MNNYKVMSYGVVVVIPNTVTRRIIKYTRKLTSDNNIKHTHFKGN